MSEDKRSFVLSPAGRVERFCSSIKQACLWFGLSVSEADSLMRDTRVQAWAQEYGRGADLEECLFSSIVALWLDKIELLKRFDKNPHCELSPAPPA